MRNYTKPFKFSREEFHLPNSETDESHKPCKLYVSRSLLTRIHCEVSTEPPCIITASRRTIQYLNPVAQIAFASKIELKSRLKCLFRKPRCACPSLFLGTPVHPRTSDKSSRRIVMTTRAVRSSYIRHRRDILGNYPVMMTTTMCST